MVVGCAGSPASETEGGVEPAAAEPEAADEGIAAHELPVTAEPDAVDVVVPDAERGIIDDGLTRPIEKSRNDPSVGHATLTLSK